VYRRAFNLVLVPVTPAPVCGTLHATFGAGVDPTTNINAQSLMSRDSPVGNEAGYEIASGVLFQAETVTLLFATADLPALDPTKSVIKYVPVAHSPVVQRPVCVKLTTLSLNTELRMRGVSSTPDRLSHATNHLYNGYWELFPRE